jgi:hypothetical protein
MFPCLIKIKLLYKALTTVLNELLMNETGRLLIAIQTICLLVPILTRVVYVFHSKFSRCISICIVLSSVPSFSVLCFILFITGVYVNRIMQMLF